MTRKITNRRTVNNEKDERLRHANSQLRRELAQARKYIKQLEAQLENMTDDEPLFVMNYEEPATIKCIIPKCGGDVKVVPAGMFEIHVCNKCGKKRTVHNLQLG
jgi:hypothetical protein